jgi:hypothetical protein
VIFPAAAAQSGKGVGFCTAYREAARRYFALARFPHSGGLFSAEAQLESVVSSISDGSLFLTLPTRWSTGQISMSATG